jgi:hypothetical protein
MRLRTLFFQHKRSMKTLGDWDYNFTTWKVLLREIFFPKYNSKVKDIFLLHLVKYQQKNELSNDSWIYCEGKIQIL